MKKTFLIVLFFLLATSVLISTKPIIAQTTYNLTVSSTPIWGISLMIDSAAYTTNTSMISLSEGTHTISIAASFASGATFYAFKKWEDGSTNPTRMVTLTADQNFVATYALSTASNVSSVTETTIEPVSYVPTRVTFNYPYTNSHDLTDITTVGNGDYNYSGSPTYYEFIAKTIDDYGFTITIGYTNVTSPTTILIGLISGNLPVQGFAVSGTTNTFIIHVRLRLTVQPSYPSTEDVAKEVMREVEQSIVSQQQANVDLLNQLQGTQLVVSAVSVVCAILAVVALVLVLYAVRRRE